MRKKSVIDPPLTSRNKNMIALFGASCNHPPCRQIFIANSGITNLEMERLVRKHNLEVHGSEEFDEFDG